MERIYVYSEKDFRMKKEILKKHGYVKTSDAYWTVIYESKNHKVVLIRDYDN